LSDLNALNALNALHAEWQQPLFIERQKT